MINVSLIAARDLNECATIAVTRRVNMLNQKFFKNVELTDKEQNTLVWLCTWDESTINNIVSTFGYSKLVVQ